MQGQTEVLRLSDMDPYTSLLLIQQPDGDIILEIDDGKKSVSIEFCTHSGGTMSFNTWMALTKLMLAMEQDQKECPQEKRFREQDDLF